MKIWLAEGRTRAYWAKHASCFGAEPVYLAVETSTVFPGEVHNLWPKLINSETTASYFSHGLESNNYSDLQLLGVMIFDTRTGHFVGNQGYISVDTPPRGSVARFGPYLARYIGWGMIATAFEDLGSPEDTLRRFRGKRSPTQDQAIALELQSVFGPPDAGYVGG